MSGVAFVALRWSQSSVGCHRARGAAISNGLRSLGKTNGGGSAIFRHCLVGWPALSQTGSRAFARVAVPPPAPGANESLGRPSDEDPLEEGSHDVASINALASLAPAYHRYAEPSDAYMEEDVSPYDHEYPENRQLTEDFGNRVRFEAPTTLSRLAALEADSEQAESSRKRKPRSAFRDDQPVRVRVLDVDALPLSDVHRAFMYTLVRRRPAEVCLRVASRVAQFRDRYKHQAYENLLRDCARLFGPTHGPELVALFSRCHATISVPYMIDYTRRYGQFSKAFIAKQVERSLQPAFFDFFRYQSKGGLRPLPLTVSRPWALSSYTRLLSKSSVKSHLHEQLLLHGCVPASTLEADTEEDLPVEARVAEQLSAAGALRVPAPVVSEWPAQPVKRSADDRVPRPALLDVIMEAEHTGRSWEEVAASRAAAADESSLMLTGSDQAGHNPNAKASDGERHAFGDAQFFRDDEDDDEEQEASGRFSLQFEHVVPDDIFDSQSQDALTLPGAGHRAGGPAAEDGHLEIPERFWSTPSRRGFFRHMYRAYRLVDDQWQQVPDPRGPRHFPRRRHPSRRNKKETQLRQEMMGRASGKKSDE